MLQLLCRLFQYFLSVFFQTKSAYSSIVDKPLMNSGNDPETVADKTKSCIGLTELICQKARHWYLENRRVYFSLIDTNMFSLLYKRIMLFNVLMQCRKRFVALAFPGKHEAFRTHGIKK